MSQKVLTLLGFASKAGKLSYGARIAAQSVKAKKAKLVIRAEGVSQKSQKEIEYFANSGNLPVIRLKEDMQTLSRAVGKTCGILSVNDKNFADPIILQEDKK